MSGSSQRIYYWDSAVYLAHIMQEQSHGAVYLQAMAQIAKDNYELKNVIFTSVITLTEVLESKLTKDQVVLFKKTFRSTNHTLHDVDAPIAEKAMQFRMNVQAQTGKVL